MFGSRCRLKHYTDRINPSWVDLRSEDSLASVAVRIPVELNQFVNLLEASLESRNRGRKSQLALPLTGPSE